MVTKDKNQTKNYVMYSLSSHWISGYAQNSKPLRFKQPPKCNYKCVQKKQNTDETGII